MDGTRQRFSSLNETDSWAFREAVTQSSMQTDKEELPHITSLSRKKFPGEMKLLDKVFIAVESICWFPEARMKSVLKDPPFPYMLWTQEGYLMYIPRWDLSI